MSDTTRIVPEFVMMDGTVASYGSVFRRAVTRIWKGSERGKGIRLSASEVRALHWSVIREDGEAEQSDTWLNTLPPEPEGEG